MNSILKPTPLKRLAFFTLLDVILSAISLYAAYALRFNFRLPDYALADFWHIFAILFFLKFFAMWIFGVYRVPWRFFGLKNLIKITKAHIIAYTVFGTALILAHNYIGFFPRSVLFIDFALSLLMLSGLRITKRIWLDYKITKEKPAIIVGAGSQGELAARWLDAHEDELYPLAFLDDDTHLQGALIHGLSVLNSHKIRSFVEKNSIKVAILTKSLQASELRSLYEFLTSIGIEQIRQAKFIDSEHTKLEQIKIEDLLARAPKDLDKIIVRDFIYGKIVLITGAGGSIGSEIARQCAHYGAKQIIALDHSEFNLYAICDELHDFNIVPVMQSVCNKQKLLDVFNKFKPQIVIHAAAYKHVPLVEANILSAIENNIIGTKNTVECSIECEVEKFTLISTDKAVRPTNVMGATKRVCELIVQNVKNAYPNSHTDVAAVRFGNVIGSSGSVVPKFKSQIANGGPITVTHPDIERYFMLISEACELTLQAAAIAKGGEIFILDMGERVKIVDLAKKMLELSGKTHEIDIVFTGLRPGEKLIEELLIDDAAEKTKYPSIFIAFATNYNYKLLNQQINELFDGTKTLEVLQTIVPEFKHNKDGNA